MLSLSELNLADVSSRYYFGERSLMWMGQFVAEFVGRSMGHKRRRTEQHLEKRTGRQTGRRISLQIRCGLAIVLGGSLWSSGLTAIAQEREGCFWVNSRGEHIDLSGYCPVATPSFEEQINGEASPNVNPADPNTVTIPIVRREGGIPIISVLFNGQPTEMMLDTGASLIVLPQRVATQLQLRPVDSVLIDTASAQDVRMDVAIVNTVQLGNLTKQELPVAISGDHIGIGLLGQNFYSDYDLTIRQDVVEFTHR